MTNTFIVWGDKKTSSLTEETKFNRKEYTNLQQHFKKEFEKVYAKDNALLCVSEGNLYQFGRFNFENNYSNEKEKKEDNITLIPIELKHNNKVKNIGLGKLNSFKINKIINIIKKSQEMIMF